MCCATDSSRSARKPTEHVFPVIEIARRSDGVGDNPYESRSGTEQAVNPLLRGTLYELTGESVTRRWSVRRIDARNR